MKKLTYIVSFLCLLLGGCQNTQAVDEKKQLTSITQAKALWQSQGFKDYQFVVQQQCFCLPSTLKPRLVTVKNNKVFSIKLLETQQADKKPSSLLLKTVDQWFAHLESIQSQPNAKVSGSFQADTGFPIRLSVDLHPRMADDEYSIIFSNFSPH